MNIDKVCYATYSLSQSYCLQRGSEFTVRGDYNYEKKNN